MIDRLHKLHFWCQKVLPLVYDESLSYYELLCKVVKYLNDHTELLNAIIDFMNSFNTDVQTVVREMAEAGELDEPLRSAIYPIIGDDYADDNNYKVNDIVIHDDKLYKCVNPTTGEWNEDDWEEITISDAITNLYNNLQNYVTYVTPEMFGAVGDGIADDTTAVQACLSSPIRLKMLCRKYKITSPLTVENYSEITGRGSLLFYSTYGFVFDNNQFITIRSLILSCFEPNIAAIYFTTDIGNIDYCNIEDCIINARQYGVYVNKTTGYCNEHKFDRLIIWGGEIGIFINNPNADNDCSSYNIYNCANETCTVCAIKLNNVSFCNIRDCRLKEAPNGTKIITEGTCSNIIIDSDTVYAAGFTLSNQTNGAIFGKARFSGVYENTFCSYAKIVKGKIIPSVDWQNNTENESDNLNSDRTAPNGTYYGQNFWYSFNTDTPVTLTLSPDYYGGFGLINKIYIWMNPSVATITIVNGDQTMTLNNDSSSSVMAELSFSYFAGLRRWKKVLHTNV